MACDPCTASDRAKRGWTRLTSAPHLVDRVGQAQPLGSRIRLVSRHGTSHNESIPEESTLRHREPDSQPGPERADGLGGCAGPLRSRDVLTNAAGSAPKEQLSRNLWGHRIRPTETCGVADHYQPTHRVDHSFWGDNSHRRPENEPPSTSDPGVDHSTDRDAESCLGDGSASRHHPNCMGRYTS
jgi:hypothetical protein